MNIDELLLCVFNASLEETGTRYISLCSCCP